jgi:hypothetical protein
MLHGFHDVLAPCTMLREEEGNIEESYISLDELFL